MTVEGPEQINAQKDGERVAWPADGLVRVEFPEDWTPDQISAFWAHWSTDPATCMPLIANRPWDPVADIEAFHRKFNVAYDGKVRALPQDLQEFRSKFQREELDEYEEAVRQLKWELSIAPALRDYASITHWLEKALDALVDETYVVLGTAHLHGYDFRAAWNRVHAANMAKVRAQVASESKRGSTYDVVKPPGWEAPSHADLVEDHAHRELA